MPEMADRSDVGDSVKPKSRSERTSPGDANRLVVASHPGCLPSFLRSTIRVDYQPDVCKDYKLTGSCGWGDTCIYLHDRGDYKKGWQLEKEWEMKKRKEEAKRRGESVDDSDEDEKYVVDSDEDDMPFACAICREEFTTQRKVIVTNCNHYFHQDCVMRRYRKGKIRCVVCKKNTGGVFNAALKLQAKLKKTIVFITHDLDESLRLGDHIGILNGGRLVQAGTPEEIIMNPADDYVEAFVKDVNRAKVLRAKTVMVKANEFNSKDLKLADVFKVDEGSYIEQFLPKVLADRCTIQVVDKMGDIKGYITEKELAISLSKDAHNIR